MAKARERIYVLGSPEVVLGFALLGIPGDTPTDAAEFEDLLRSNYADPRTALILVEEGLVDRARPAVEELWARRELPLIVEIPGSSGAIERPSVREYIAGALGIKL
jgi:vacuolar-type H+-ATPase subunit F/Vma7